MKYYLTLTIFFMLCIDAFSQVDCDDLVINADTLYTDKDRVFTGTCIDYNNSRHVLSKAFITNGLEDSVVFLYRNGQVKSVEHYVNRKRDGLFRTYYKNGILKQSISFKNDRNSGFWQEYYQDGKIKYEAEYLDDGRLANDSYYTWTEKGEKKSHPVKDLPSDKKIKRPSQRIKKNKTKK